MPSSKPEKNFKNPIKTYPTALQIRAILAHQMRALVVGHKRVERPIARFTCHIAHGQWGRRRVHPEILKFIRTSCQGGWVNQNELLEKQSNLSAE